MLALSSMWHQLEGIYINWFLEVYNEFVLVPKIWTLWTPTSAWDQRDVFDVVGKRNRWFQYDRFARLVFHVWKNYHIDQRLLFINNIYIYIYTYHALQTHQVCQIAMPTTPINQSHSLNRCTVVPCLASPWGSSMALWGTRAWSKSIQQHVAFFGTPVDPIPGCQTNFTNGPKALSNSSP